MWAGNHCVCDLELADLVQTLATPPRGVVAWLGHPVVGDRRYGGAGGAGGAGASARLGLHAHRLELTDPRTGDRLEFEAPPDPKLLALVRGRARSGD